jgi:hypothetical protein
MKHQVLVCLFLGKLLESLLRNINALDVSWMEANKTKGKEKRSGTFI